ncbi:hypothetical protein L1987_11171 [Smallanthus sonchifolius]|uniref:Uncharacterized protein n=1 Tax=Smallanthus sonchifolius TaxID=185202 RepID=A0ACB9JCG1_9ASTR|nr:hypothetical protein L1987_11171 [Smallanthus sonchifolius]
MLFRIKDSMNLLPDSLNNNGKSLCPSLGSKGSIDHENVSLSNLASDKEILLEYMKQDILLLGGIMHKAQEILSSVSIGYSYKTHSILSSSQHLSYENLIELSVCFL